MKRILINNSLILLFWTLTGKIIGFLRDIVLSYLFGASIVSDAFLVSLSIPTIIFSGIISALVTTYIPVLSKINSNNERLQLNRNLCTLLFIFSLFSCLVLYIGSNLIILIFSGGMSREAMDLAIIYFKISIWCLPFLSLTYLYTAIFQYSEKYFYVGINGIILNTSIILGMLLLRNNIEFLSVSIILGYGIQTLFFYHRLKKERIFHYSFYLNLQDSNVRLMTKKMLPIFSGQIISEINSIIDKNMASQLVIGTISSLDYSYKVLTMVQGIITFPISTILFTKLSKSKGKFKQDAVIKSVVIVLLLIVPLNIIIYCFSTEIIQLLFYRGAFGIDALIKTSECLKVYSIGLLPLTLRVIIEKLFYSETNTKIPMKSSFYGIIVNIVLDFVLINIYGHKGLAFATSVSLWISYIYMHSKMIRLYGFSYNGILFIIVSFVIFEYFFLSKLCLFIDFGKYLFNLVFGSIIIIIIHSLLSYMIIQLLNKKYNYKLWN